MNTLTQSTYKNILVTGGAGFVGSHLSRRLNSLGHSVRVIDLKKPESPIDGVTYFQGDVRNPKLLSEVMGNIHAVYHLAATVSVPLCQKDPVDSYSNNFMATLSVLEAIRERSEKEKSRIPFIFASTAAVYGNRGDDGRALKETDTAAEFSSFYAAQKHASEKAIDLYARAYGIPATVFRFFNIYGPGQDPSSPYSGVITLFLKYAKDGKPLPLNAGGGQTRDFISVHDIVDACERALKVPLEICNSMPINLGTGKSITVRQLAELIRDKSSNRPESSRPPLARGT